MEQDNIKNILNYMIFTLNSLQKQYFRGERTKENYIHNVTMTIWETLEILYPEEIKIKEAE